ncbi:uncharacterized protein LOC119687376 [Teleopsis dalmanni]|uniref:uncharacterized protein LOC119687376 n=1 Tax=Teleopsis dalmanni TaxID=139649 RepID=UPI0018CE0449|nr:uncharacterized protein LOC119687376 [Teleopsis dalmanni]
MFTMLTALLIFMCPYYPFPSFNGLFFSHQHSGSVNKTILAKHFLVLVIVVVVKFLILIVQRRYGPILYIPMLQQIVMMLRRFRDVVRINNQNEVRQPEAEPEPEPVQNPLANLHELQMLLQHHRRRRMERGGGDADILVFNNLRLNHWQRRRW